MTAWTAYTCRILGTVRSVLLYIVDTCGDYHSPELVQGMNLLFNSPPGAEAYFVKSMHSFVRPVMYFGSRRGSSRLGTRVCKLDSHTLLAHR
jgi:hypothetical protein